MLPVLLLALQTVNPLAVIDDRLRSEQDILHYQITITLSDTSDAIRAAASVRYVARGGAGPLRLDFDSVFVIDSIVSPAGRINAAAASAAPPARRTAGWQLVRGNGGWILEVPHWGARGDTLEVTVHYRGRPRDGLFLGPNRYGAHAAFADNWPNRARHWFPAHDHPSDKATAAFTVEVPAGWRAVANGALAGVDSLPGGRTRWRWATDRPIPTYTMVIGAGRMAVTPVLPVNGVPQSLWTFPEDSAFAVQGPFRRVGLMLETYTGLLGPFPYEKLAHVQSSTRFGGMENSSVIFYAERAYAERSLREETVAHEIAHQWFGDAVTAHDWHHLWLSEGFASYLGPMFFELVNETPRFREAMERNRRVYMASEVVDRPIIDTTEKHLFNLLNENTYPKAAWVLHMLRGEVGDSAFVAGLRAYYAEFRDSTALSSDFAAVMERASGRSLEGFFRQWLLQPGYPRLGATWSWQAGRLSLEIRQLQSEGWGLYRLRVPVRAELANGETVDFTVDLRGDAASAEQPLSARPTRLLLDPEGTLLMETVEVTERR